MQQRADTWIVVEEPCRNADGREIGCLAGSIAPTDAATFAHAPRRRFIVRQHVLAGREAKFVRIDMRISRERRATELSANRAMAGRERADLVDLETHRAAHATSMNHRVLSITAAKNPSVCVL